MRLTKKRQGHRAKLIPIPRYQCWERECKSEATVTLYDRWGDKVGSYCSLCGEYRLRKLDQAST